MKDFINTKRRAINEKYNYTQSVNHPVQGTAAEVVLTALNKLFTIGLVNCVHDEIITEVRDEDVEETKTRLAQRMTGAMCSIFPQATTVKLIEVKHGKSWAELK